MQCPVCQTASKKFGKPKGFQRYHCPSCKKSWSERPARQLGEMRLPVERALLVLHLLTGGCSIRAIKRITGTEKRTILRLLVQVGEGCELLLPELVKGATVKDVQAEEFWGYVRCKEGTKERRGITDPEAGDAYFHRPGKALQADPGVAPGPADRWHTHDFMERSNWTLRGHLRRMTRLSNGFSRKRANLRAALALYFVYYNFRKFHKSIRMTPAMAAGVVRRPWTMADLLAAAHGAA